MLDDFQLFLLFTFEGEDEVAQGSALLEEEQKSWPVRQVHLDHRRTSLHTVFVLDEGQAEPALQELVAGSLLPQISLIDVSKYSESFVQINVEMDDLAISFLDAVVNDNLSDQLNLAHRQSPYLTLLLPCKHLW